MPSRAASAKVESVGHDPDEVTEPLANDRVGTEVADSPYALTMRIVPTWGRSATASRGRRTVLAALLVILVVAGVPAGASAGTRPGYTLDLGRRVDFVAQTNNVQCVGASTQMMLNMIRPGVDRTAATQLRLQKVARAWSGPRPDGRIRKGAGVMGWAAGLTLAGAGPYRVVGLPTIDEALLVAARAMQATGRPVGLLMWHGRHAWVMSGFTATRDPVRPGAPGDRGDRRGSALSARFGGLGAESRARRHAQRQDARSPIRAPRQLVGHVQHGGDVRPRPAVRIRRSDPSAGLVPERPAASAASGR